MSNFKRLFCGTMLLGGVALAAVGCATQPGDQSNDGQSVHDRPEPVTGSLIRRDRSTTNVKTADPDSVAAGMRSSTGARAPGN